MVIICEVLNSEVLPKTSVWFATKLSWVESELSKIAIQFPLLSEGHLSRYISPCPWFALKISTTELGADVPETVSNPPSNNALFITGAEIPLLP